MTDAELIARLREIQGQAGLFASAAAARIEALIAENERLGQQCEGLMQAGMNNGQALILAEAKLAKAVEALEFYATQDVIYPHVGKVTFTGYDDDGRLARATLEEIKKENGK